jgi:para-aminobenzoate synthetase component 1
LKQNIPSFANAINAHAREKRPFLFILDFDCSKPIVRFIDEINPDEILFNFRGFTNQPSREAGHTHLPYSFSKSPMPFGKYKERFHRVKEELLKGNSYLLNLTFPTAIETSLTLKEIFIRSNAPYKLLYNSKGGKAHQGLNGSGADFVVFSPESFVRIKNGVISSFPMKGTINAAIPNARKIILEDAKELAEHSTIVDLIRNDLNMVAGNVKLARFRYVESIKTHNSELLQVSSEIKGKVKKELLCNYGELLTRLLPAGSVTGAPKRKTVEIIKETEGYERGYYTGVFGYSDGETLESAVMIRFIEQNEKGLCFKSGGGITIYSNPESEYRELIDKVYVPFD